MKLVDMLDLGSSVARMVRVRPKVHIKYLVIHSSKIIYYIWTMENKKEAVASRLGFVVTEEGVAYNKKEVL
jgi:hypothetical protein